MLHAYRISDGGVRDDARRSFGHALSSVSQTEPLDRHWFRRRHFSFYNTEDYITTHAKRVRSLATERHVAVFPADVRIHRVAPRTGRVPRIRTATEVDGDVQFRDGEVVILVGVRVGLL